jgi:hypothetical protein
MRFVPRRFSVDDGRREVRALLSTLLLAAATALGAWGLSASSQGCALSNCDGDVVYLDGAPSTADQHHEPAPPQQRLIDDSAWESNPIEGHWLPFPPQRSVVLSVPFATNRPLVDFLAYVSPARLKGTTGNDRELPEDGFTDMPNDPAKPGGQFANAAGNIAEFSYVVPEGDHWKVTVHNDTCASFWLRVVIHAGPPGSSDAGTPDGSAPIDAGDASSPVDAGDSGPIDAQNDTEQ